MANAPTACSNALAAVELRRRGITEVAVVGDRPDLLGVLRAAWHPGVVLAWGEPYDSPLWAERAEGCAYVCQQFMCEQPAADTTTFEQQLQRR
jgi:uncharacterized protein YyaL (SSP411 family)